MLPTRKLRNATRPRKQVRELRAVDRRRLLVIVIAHKREVRDRRLLAQNERARGEVLVDDAEGPEYAAAQELDHRRICALLNADQPAQRRVIARKLVIVEEDPAQDLEALLRAPAAETAGALGEMREDRTALRQPLAVVLEHGHFALLVQRVAVLSAARLPAEVVDERRAPLAAAQRQHQRDLVAVAGFTDAVETVGIHALRSRDRDRDSHRSWIVDRES